MTPSNSTSPAPREEITFTDIGRLLWRRLKEMKTAFYILVVFAIGTLLATVIPQQQDPGYYQERYGLFLSNLVVRLGMDHVASVWWFHLVIALLMLSLIACTGNLWNIARTRWKIPAAGDADPILAQCRSCAPENLSGSAAQATVTAVAAARHAGYRVWSQGEKDGSHALYLCRHRWTAWGAMLAHYAIFLVGVGALLGTMPGISVDTNLDLAEGQTTTAEQIAMPFQLRLNAFRIEMGATTDAVENYYSDLSVMDGEREVLRRTISVNRPLKYRGYYVSQSSWGLDKVRLKVTVKGKAHDIAFPLVRGMDEMIPWGVPREEAVVFIPGTNAALVASTFYLDAMRQKGEVTPMPSEFPGKMALGLILVSGIPDKMAPMESRLPGDATISPASMPAAEAATVSFAGFSPQLAQMPPAMPPGEADPHAGMGRKQAPPLPPDAVMPPGHEGMMGGEGGMSMPPGHGGMGAPHNHGGAMPPAKGGGGKPGHGFKDLGFVMLGETLKTPAGDVKFEGVSETSGLGIRKDPGVSLVWAGFILCVLGLCLIFYFPFSQAYIVVSPREGRAQESRVQVRVRGGLMSDPGRDTEKILAEIKSGAPTKDV